MKPDRRHDLQPKTLKKTSLAVLLIVLIAFSVFLGITAGAIGLGSIYPQINTIAQPVACPGRTMSHSQQISEIGTATYYAAKWYCVDEQTGERSEVSGNTVALISGPVYGVVIFLILFAVFVVALVEGLRLPLRESPIWRLWPLGLILPLALFLGLQFLQTVIQKPQSR